MVFLEFTYQFHIFPINSGFVYLKKKEWKVSHSGIYLYEEVVLNSFCQYLLIPYFPEVGKVQEHRIGVQ